MMSSAAAELKVEPSSPLSDYERDAWFFFEDDSVDRNDYSSAENVSLLPRTKAEMAQQLLDDLDDLDDLVKRETTESFSEWFEEKVNLPIFDEIDSILPGEGQAKQGLAQELQDLELALHHGQLTPPQSPPAKEVHHLQPAQQQQIISEEGYILPDENVVHISLQPCINVTPVYSEPFHNYVVQPTYITLLAPSKTAEPEPPKSGENYLTAPPTPIPDLEKEMAVVDEVVRSTAQNLDSNWDQWESETSRSESSSASFSSSPRGSSTEEESDDPEWMPESDNLGPGKAAKPSRRPKPYSRCGNPEDKRLRKKEQNKNAATRYRQKKKAEVSEILEEEKQMEDKNAELEQKVTDMKTEIKYLKGLMRDLFRAKGLIK